MLRRVLGCAVVVLLMVGVVAGTALGHASMTSATPATDSTVAAPPSEIRVRFSEPIEVAFSNFKVYALSVSESDNAKAAAAELVADVLQLRNDQDEPARVDVGVLAPTRSGSEIVVGLEKELAPGQYVVMWRALSVDSHTTQGFYVFSYSPSPE